MIDYDSFARPPRRRHGRAVVATLVAVLLVAGGLAALVVGHVVTIGGRAPSLAAAGSSAAPAAVASAPVNSPAGELTLGACVDPTASIVSSFAPTIQSDLAQAVGSLAPPAGALPTNTLSGGPVTLPQPGVNLTVRQVNTTSLASDLALYTRNLVVPPVPGLARSRPDPGGQDYLSQLRAWSAGYATVSAARAAARGAAAAGAAKIAGMSLDRNGWSDIIGCISGLLTTVPAGGMHSYLLASDLEQNVPPQMEGSFHGAPLAIIQTCDTGNAAHCLGLLQSFINAMHHLDVGPITVVRPEDAASAVSQWIRTGEVTS